MKEVGKNRPDCTMRERLGKHHFIYNLSVYRQNLRDLYVVSYLISQCTGIIHSMVTLLRLLRKCLKGILPRR